MCKKLAKKLVLLHSTEVAFLLLTQRPRVWFLAFPKINFYVAEIYRWRLLVLQKSCNSSFDSLRIRRVPILPFRFRKKRSRVKTFFSSEDTFPSMTSQNLTQMQTRWDSCLDSKAGDSLRKKVLLWPDNGPTTRSLIDDMVLVYSFSHFSLHR